MIESASTPRQLITWLDDAIDEHDCGAPVSALASVLDVVARWSTARDPSFSRRVAHIAARTRSVVETHERDAASMLAREIRRDVMCMQSLEKSKATARNPCAPNANRARPGQRAIAQTGSKLA